MGAFTFLDFVQPRSFREDFSFSRRAMTLYSASCFGGNVCRLFAQMYVDFCMFYGSCVRFWTYFTHIVRILCTYTAYLFSMLCGFCVRIRIFCALSGLAYVYGLSFSMFDAEILEGSNLAVYLIFFFVLTLVIRGQSRGSDLEGSVEFFFRASCLLLLGSLEDPILRVPSSYFSERAARDSIYNITSEVSCWYW